MPYRFSSIAGRLNPAKTLTIDVYVGRLDAGILTPKSKALGFKTYVTQRPKSPSYLARDRYIAAFRAHWATAVEEVAASFGVAPDKATRLIALVGSIGRASPMTTTRPMEHGKEQMIAPKIVTSPESTTSRTERKNAVLKKLRAPPLTHEWEFWHDRITADQPTQVPATDKTTSPSSGGPVYGTGLVKLMDINNVQTFWETFNNFPLGSLVLRDSVHLFKKTVRPVWEDKRNVRGGSWTFRVPKSDGPDFWKNIQMMAIGETLQEVIEPGDDICGVSLSIRFNSHLISVWNRDGSNQKSIDAILACILTELPNNLKPSSPQNHYYKKHAEHKGFSSEKSS